MFSTFPFFKFFYQELENDQRMSFFLSGGKMDNILYVETSGIVFVHNSEKRYIIGEIPHTMGNVFPFKFFPQYFPILFTFAYTKMYSLVQFLEPLLCMEQTSPSPTYETKLQSRFEQFQEKQPISLSFPHLLL